MTNIPSYSAVNIDSLYKIKFFDRAGTFPKIKIFCRLSLPHTGEDVMDTGIEIRETYWDYDTQRAKKSYTGALKINQRLDEIALKIKKYIHYCIRNNNQVTPQRILLKVVNDGELMGVLYHYDDYITMLEQDKMVCKATIETYKHSMALWKVYLIDKFDIDDIPIDRFTDNHVDGFVFWAYNQKEKANYSIGYVRNALSHMSIIYQDLIRKKFVAVNPCEHKLKKVLLSYNRYKAKNKLVNSFTMEEMRWVINYCKRSTTISSKFFLFQMFQGLSYNDVYRCKYGINDKGVMYGYGTRKKTGEPFMFPIFEETKELLQDFETKNGYEFPYVPLSVLDSFLKTMQRKLFPNKNIKISSHIARYNFIQLRQSQGYTNEFISHCVGHNSTQMIEKTYGKISPNRMFLEYQNNSLSTAGTVDVHNNYLNFSF